MSIQQFGYSVESLQTDKIENFEKELESQTKLTNIRLDDTQSAFGGMFDQLEKLITYKMYKKIILTMVKPR